MPTGQSEGGNPSIGVPSPQLHPQSQVLIKLTKTNLHEPLPQPQLLCTENYSVQPEKDCSEVGSLQGEVDVGRWFSSCLPVQRSWGNQFSGDQSRKLQTLTLRISFILKKIWPWMELGPKGFHHRSTPVFNQDTQDWNFQSFTKKKKKKG